jgi:hypothetical protein
VSRRALALMPMSTQRASPTEVSSSWARDNGSSRDVAASSKLTPCFLRLAAAFAASYSISICILYAYHPPRATGASEDRRAFQAGLTIELSGAHADAMTAQFIDPASAQATC